MLVLTRRLGESVIIDGEVEVKLLRIKGRQVHLGIEAAPEHSILRREIWERDHNGVAPGHRVSIAEPDPTERAPAPPQGHDAANATDG